MALSGYPQSSSSMPCSSKHSQCTPHFLEAHPLWGFQDTTVAWVPSCLSAYASWSLAVSSSHPCFLNVGRPQGSASAHPFSRIHLLWPPLLLSAPATLASLLPSGRPPSSGLCTCCSLHLERPSPRCLPGCPLHLLSDILSDLLFKFANPSCPSSLPVPISGFIFLHSHCHPPLNRPSMRTDICLFCPDTQSRDSAGHRAGAQNTLQSEPWTECTNSDSRTSRTLRGTSHTFPFSLQDYLLFLSPGGDKAWGHHGLRVSQVDMCSEFQETHMLAWLSKKPEGLNLLPTQPAAFSFSPKQGTQWLSSPRHRGSRLQVGRQVQEVDTWDPDPEWKRPSHVSLCRQHPLTFNTSEAVGLSPLAR